MIVDNKRIQSELEKILPTYYDQIVEETNLPCITFYEVGNNNDYVWTSEMGYSNIIWNVKVVGDDISVVAPYTQSVDDAMRKLGYKRTSSNDLILDGIIQKVLTYEGLGFELYTNNILEV